MGIESTIISLIIVYIACEYRLTRELYILHTICYIETYNYYDLPLPLLH